MHCLDMVELERGEGKRKENMVFPMFGCFDRKEMIEKGKRKCFSPICLQIGKEREKKK